MNWVEVSEASDHELHPLDLLGFALKDLASEPVASMCRDELRHRAVTLQTYRQGLDGSAPTRVCRIPRDYAVRVEVLLPPGFFRCPGSS